MGKDKEAIPVIIDNFRRVIQIVNEYSKAAEKSVNLTGSQLWALKIIANASPLRVSDLAHHMYLHPATVVGILDRLEGKGLITRCRSKKDRRTVELFLTGKGAEVTANAPEVAQSLLMNGLNALPEGQFYCVEEGLKQLVLMLGAEHAVPQPQYS